MSAISWFRCFNIFWRIKQIASSWSNYLASFETTESLFDITVAEPSLLWLLQSACYISHTLKQYISIFSLNPATPSQLKYVARQLYVLLNAESKLNPTLLLRHIKFVHF